MRINDILMILTVTKQLADKFTQTIHKNNNHYVKSTVHCCVEQSPAAFLGRGLLPGDCVFSLNFTIFTKPM